MSWHEDELRGGLAQVRCGQMSRRRFVDLAARLGLGAPLAWQLLSHAGIARAQNPFVYAPTRRGGGGLHETHDGGVVPDVEPRVLAVDLGLDAGLFPVHSSLYLHVKNSPPPGTNRARNNFRKLSPWERASRSGP